MNIDTCKNTLSSEAGLLNKALFVDQDQKKVDLLLDYALQIGVTKATCLSPEEISVEERLAAFCEEPKCRSWGLSMSCPPRVGGPAVFRKKLAASSHVIVIRIEVPASSLLGDERTSIFRYLHEMTAEIESEAKNHGFLHARGYAGGSCKRSFCHDHEHCSVFSEGGKCRFPRHARESMSGYGVNVNKMIEASGWSTKVFVPSTDDSEEQLSWIAGIVLLS